MKISIYLSLLFCAATMLLAADPEDERVSVKFRCIGLAREFRQMELYLESGDGEARQAIQLNDLAKTNYFEYRGIPTLQFFSEVSGGAPLVSWQYNESLKEPLFIFTQRDGMDALRITAIEDSWSVYGVNSYLLVNMSDRPLYWQVGKERFKIDDKAFKVIKVPKSEAKTPVIALEVDENGETSRVYRAKWHNLPNMRRLIFVRAAGETETGSVRIQVIEDFAVRVTR